MNNLWSDSVVQMSGGHHFEALRADLVLVQVLLDGAGFDGIVLTLVSLEGAQDKALATLTTTATAAHPLLPSLLL